MTEKLIADDIDVKLSILTKLPVGSFVIAAYENVASMDGKKHRALKVGKHGPGDMRKFFVSLESGEYLGDAL